MLELQWWQWLVSLVAILAAVAAIWRIIRYIFKIDRAMPILLKIAGEFENNGGSSTLKDKLDKVLEITQEQQIRSNWAVKLSEDSRLIAQTNAKIVEELTSVQTSDLIQIREHLQTKLAELTNQVNLMGLQAAITEKRGERIEVRLDSLLPFVVRHREGEEE